MYSRFFSFSRRGRAFLSIDSISEVAILFSIVIVPSLDFIHPIGKKTEFVLWFLLSFCAYFQFVGHYTFLIHPLQFACTKFSRDYFMALSAIFIPLNRKLTIYFCFFISLLFLSLLPVMCLPLCSLDLLQRFMFVLNCDHV